jgi:hypothetical protein
VKTLTDHTELEDSSLFSKKYAIRPIFSLLNPVHNFMLQFSKVQLNVILPYAPGYLKNIFLSGVLILIPP